MTPAYRLTVLLLATAAVSLAIGCGGGKHIRYEPNTAVRGAPRFEKTVAVTVFADKRPSSESVNSLGHATNDIDCTDIVCVALAKSIRDDLANAGLFLNVTYQDKAPDTPKADAILYGEVRHLYAEYHQNWLRPGAVPFMFLLAPFYVPCEYSKQHVELHLKLVDAKDSQVLWEDTLEREWTYGPMTAFQFLRGTSLLYKRLRERLRTEMAGAIRDMDTTLGGRWASKEPPLAKTESPPK